MFGGVTYDLPSTGKRVYGLSMRKEPELALGWDLNNQMNQFQLKKNKNKEITGKITTNTPIKKESANYISQPQYELQQRDYQRFLYENPDVPVEQLERMMVKYDQYRGGPSQNSRKQESRSTQSNQQQQRRVPIRPRESMRDIIYNGVGVNNQDAYGQRVGSRVLFDDMKRNNSNFNHQSYNYQGKI